MKTITDTAGKTVKMYADQIHAMEICKSNGFAAKQSEFEIGRSRRYMRFILPRTRDGMAKLGLYTCNKEAAKTSREKAFFKENPRCVYGVFGKPRRINALLKKVYE